MYPHYFPINIKKLGYALENCVISIEDSLIKDLK